MPRSHILLAVFLLAFALITNSKTTSLQFITVYELDQQDDIIELSLDIKTEGKNLAGTIHEAKEVIDGITKLSEQHCQSQAKNKKEKKQCDQIVEANKYDIETKYIMVRKVPTFHLFIVKHQLTISIKHISGLGKLIDNVMEQSEGMATLNEFVWMPQKEKDAQQQSLKQAIQEGKQMCKHMKMKFDDIIKVQELEDEEKKQQNKDEQRDPDLNEEDVEKIILKVMVNCVN